MNPDARRGPPSIAMTSEQRFLTALDGGQTDRVPLFDFLFQEPLHEALIGDRPVNYNGRDAIACARALNHDGAWLPFGGFSGYRPRFLRENVYQDAYGTPDEVAAEVREAIDLASPGGDYILASDHSLHDGIPVPNIREMFHVGLEHGTAVYAQEKP